ncbi:PD-(D/E)XK nuclease family protein [uncultured Lutibacter sp.]|uniref:PD-(D/E)XK nuclease family protein n=1 Tax=uncultured Lutibacter sp. TaxID=437739 RepID=UPI00261B495D|nr:PD-(D/E)XK nuclease family protein [uncultured Lutibacter sp.]
MISFISRVVDDIFSKQKGYENLIFVLPSQRSCVFLKEEIIKKLPTSSFLPKIISIENYIQEIGDISLIDNTQLLFEFYSIYKQNLPKENIEPFDAFYQWATIALHDFNEIDSYLVNSEVFFNNLRDVKKLEEWFQDKKPSQLAINYLQFFEYLHILYKGLNKKLKNNKFGYQGLIYKEAKNNLEFYINNNVDKHIVFVGFNALNKAEEYIIQELLNNNIASVYWDANQTIFNKFNEAGVFLRKYKSEWVYYQNNPFLWIENEEITNQNINLIGAPKNITQIKYAGELISKLENFNKTALVLADENLLTLALNSLPNNVKNINITMGYSLKDIPIASLFDAIFKLHLNQQKFNKVEEQVFYHKDVLNVLNDPFLNKLYNETLQKIGTKIKSENSIFLGLETLKKWISVTEEKELSLLFSLFDFSTDINAIITQCCSLLNELKEFVVGVEKEYLYRFYTIFQQLESLNSTYNHIADLKTLTLFYNQLLQNEKLSFQGEPLQGLQLMGMLETRALDFETVIITSVNEGILPAGKNDFSFIPYDIKKHFGLPTYQEKDAIFSYHFQRLLMRAKNIYLIYNTENDGYGSGEKSRFLTQLEINNPSITKTIISPKVQHIEVPLIQIEKTEEVLQKLKEVFIKGISPSALATYIYNPVSFYEQKVLGIYEDDEVEEIIAANTMGSVIHDVLEEMYLPYLNKFLKKENIAEMQKKCNFLLTKYFGKHYLKGNVQTGKNKLIFEVSKNLINRFLKQEMQLLNENKQLKIIALEEKLNTEIIVEGVNFPINLRGIVDRIDELDGVTRIIDYKTGKVEANQLKIYDFSVISEDYKYTKAMQVLLYSYLYTSKINRQISPLQSGVISFKNLNSGFIKMNFSDKFRGTDYEVTDERIQDFMVQIKNLIYEISDPAVPFIENKNLPF